VFALLGDTAALGFSWTQKRPVAELLSGRVSATLALTLPAFALALITALIAGVLAARRPRRALDRVVTALSTASIAIPPYWLGLILIAIFAAHWRALPAGGRADPGAPLSSSLAHAILPVLVLAIAWAGPLTRYVRAAVVNALPQDYVRTARSKGLGERAVLLGHALRSALLPAITAIGLLLPQLFAGALLTETVFAWPGIGRLQVEAISSGDSYVAVVIALIEAALVLTGNWLADAAVALADPRLREPRR
jgi:peptide/nickel transport system permease protein